MFLDTERITPKLHRHVESMFPGRGAIENGTGVPNKAAYQLACSVLFCSVLFKEGCIFASFKQLKQVATLFLDKWGVKKCVQHGKKIVPFTSP
jgi:hypothetical protein